MRRWIERRLTHLRRRTPPASLLKNQDGFAIVELALVVPILVLLFFGLWDFGRAFAAQSLLSRAAEAGVLYGAQSVALSQDFAGIEDAARRAAADLDLPLTVTPQRTCECPGEAPVACGGTCDDGAPPAIYVSVQAAAEFTTRFPYPLVDSPLQLDASVTMRAQ